MLQGVEKPTAAKLLDHVDPSYLLGLPPAEAAGPPALGTRRKSVPVLAYFMQVKRQHPTKVVLVRVSALRCAVLCCAMSSCAAFSCTKLLVESTAHVLSDPRAQTAASPSSQWQLHLPCSKQMPIPGQRLNKCGPKHAHAYALSHMPIRACL